MLPLILLITSALLCWIVYRAINLREIIFGGWGSWGSGTRSYSRDEQPVGYWVGLTSYAICAVVSLVYAIRLI